MLPDATGWDTLRELKGHPQTQAIPVIMLTGNCVTGSEDGHELAAAVLEKPCQAQLLMMTIADALSASRDLSAAP